MMRFRCWLCIVALAGSSLAIAQDGPVIQGAYRLMHAEQPDSAGAGLVLISELMCAACHDLPDAVHGSISWKPRTPRPLSTATPGEVHAFIASPSDAKPGATMPKHELSEYIVDELSRFVESLGKPSGAQPTLVGSVERGADLYHTVGCIACHAPLRPPGDGVDADDPFAVGTVVDYPAPSIPSVPIRHGIGSVEGFLKATSSSRMPHMKLGEEEATAIAAYLASESEPATVANEIRSVPGDNDAFIRIGCAQCHAEVTSNDTYIRTAITSSDRGCLAETVHSPAVDYAFSGWQRSAIRDALALDAPRTDAGWRVLGTAAANNCLACHQRDGYGGIEPGRVPYFTTTVDADLGDEGRIPPTLTGVGAKLTRDALTQVLTGHGDVRPYMATRMPLFDLGDVDSLVSAFVEADRDAIHAEVNVTGLEHHHRNHYGRELMGTNALGCVSCHDLNGHRSLGIPAVDLARAPSRLRPEWFMAYMSDPASLRPGTRMPAYFPGGKSTYPSLFNGNSRQQIEAIWIYLREIEQTRLPDGMEDAAQYIVVPNDAPVVHRTFLKDVGARAIAVGFPEGIHYAFDATLVRASLAWCGDFLDANSTWNDRFSPYVEPLSDDRWAFPAGMPFATGDGPAWPIETGRTAGYAFKGFRLDDSGTPEFRYEFNGMTIGERISPESSGKGLRRVFSIENATAPFRFLAARGTTIDKRDGGYRIDDQWTTHVDINVGEMIIEQSSTVLVIALEPSDGRIAFTQEIAW